MNNIVKPLQTTEEMPKIIEDVFGVKLDISGGWGYDKNSSVVVHKLDNTIEQFVDMFINIRTNIEFNLTLSDDNRYANINLSLKEINKIVEDGVVYYMSIFKFTAMKEKIYSDFVQEYKDNYNKKDFDIENHFKRRKDNTITKDMECWVKADL